MLAIHPLSNMQLISDGDIVGAIFFLQKNRSEPIRIDDICHQLDIADEDESGYVFSRLEWLRDYDDLISWSKSTGYKTVDLDKQAEDLGIASLLECVCV